MNHIRNQQNDEQLLAYTGFKCPDSIQIKGEDPEIKKTRTLL
jgi:hypothetical protein